jgi:hypothetical protein
MFNGYQCRWNFSLTPRAEPTSPNGLRQTVTFQHKFFADRCLGCYLANSVSSRSVCEYSAHCAGIGYMLQVRNLSF